MSGITNYFYSICFIIGPLLTIVFYLYFDHKRRIAGMCLGAVIVGVGLLGLIRKYWRRRV